MLLEHQQKRFGLVRAVSRSSHFHTLTPSHLHARDNDCDYEELDAHDVRRQVQGMVDLCTSVEVVLAVFHLSVSMSKVLTSRSQSCWSRSRSTLTRSDDSTCDL